MNAGAERDPFDPRGEQKRQARIRPKDAATLILVRRRAKEPEILMGQRAEGHVFMASKWVFPGGRVDPADALAPAASELDPDTEEALRRFCPRRRVRAFALAAVRETFEETGLIVGRAGTHGAAPALWRAYAAQGAAPALAKLQFIARAITPANRPRRYDARFFLADAEVVLLDERPIAGDQELAQIRWFSLEEAAGLDLPNVTRAVLGEVKARLAGEDLRPVFWRRGAHGYSAERL